MTNWLCATCGIEYGESANAPAVCPICSDERQYLPPGGQQWTTLEAVQREHTADVDEIEPDLYGITITPGVGIGHRPLLVRTPAGNLLWDAPGYIDDQLIETVKGLGGIAVIASSHPHLTGLSITWSRAFGGVPVFVNEDDRQWIQRPDDVIQRWRDREEPLPRSGLTLVQCGGHFAGSAVLHWPAGANGKGAILTGDTIRVNADRRTVSFMRSYPNLIPLSPRSVRKIVAAVEPFPYDRIHSGFRNETLRSGAKQAVADSADRYIGWLTDELRDADERVD
jgi:glyoxylase-like metal-dependent hydrolase (beta-lactamase superfamily II)